MCRFQVLVVLVAIASESSKSGAAGQDLLATSLIVGGSNASIGSYPYQVNLLLNGTHVCGASIISNRWIITAAHCVPRTINEYSARIGSTFVDSGGSVYSFSSKILHENYNEDLGFPVNDIAVLEVSTPIVFNTTRRPIPMFNVSEEAVDGVNGVVTGWGVLAENSTVASTVLQKVNVPIVSKSECNSSYASIGGIGQGEICAGRRDGGRDSCQGDSGGPLAIGHRLAGIVSWGNGCAQAQFPGVYTEVAWYRDWITSKTGL